MSIAQEHPDAYGAKGLRVVDHAGIWLRTRSLRRHIATAKPQSLLDLGCGFQANTLRALEGSVPQLTGVDLQVDPALRASSAIAFEEGPIEEVLAGMEDRSYDLVTILSVLEHVHDAQLVLDEMHRVVKPGGTIIVHVPTWLGKPVLDFLAFRLGMGMDSINDHRAYYWINQLWPMVIKSGFRSQDVKMRYHTLGCALTAKARRHQP